jgi:hypothetical protein
VLTNVEGVGTQNSMVYGKSRSGPYNYRFKDDFKKNLVSKAVLAVGIILFVCHDVITSLFI